MSSNNCDEFVEGLLANSNCSLEQLMSMLSEYKEKKLLDQRKNNLSKNSLETKDDLTNGNETAKSTKEVENGSVTTSNQAETALVIKTSKQVVKKYKKRKRSVSPRIKKKVAKPENHVLHNKLKEQLDLLRNRKKALNLPTGCREFTPSVSTKKHLVPNILNKVENTAEDNLDFVISSVVGGYVTPPENSECNLESEESELINEHLASTCIVLKKTNDVTKIKGWKNKKFFIPVNLKNVSTEFMMETEENTNLQNDLISNTPNEIYVNEPIAHCSNTNVTYILPSSVMNYAENFPPEFSKQNVDSSIINAPRKERKSAFVSDALDTYLNKNSELQISYEVPKLIAEKENLADLNDKLLNSIPAVIPVKVSRFENTQKEDNARQKKNPRETLIKAKTVAERKKFMAMGMLPVFTKKDEITKPKIKIKPLSKIPKIFHIPKNQFSEKPLVSEITTENTTNRYGTIFYNMKKLRVPTKNNEKHVWCIKNIKQKKQQKNYMLIAKSKTKKLQLLRSLQCEEENMKNTIIQYKPGPLSKKYMLQKSNSSRNWKTVIKKLPKIILEVKPEIGKEIDPSIRHLIPHDVQLTNEMINFALSTLITNKNPEKIAFTIAYANNQENLLLREKIGYLPRNETQNIDNCDDPIKKVIDGLLDYVEHRSIADTLIKEDDFQMDVMEDDNKIEENDASSIKKKPKRNKIMLELQRLSVKLINMENTETGTKINCDKLYCAMGCVCSSLECVPRLPVHCERIACMFNCTCGYKNSSADEDLSANTVNLLENAVKQNLAKEEKEFTQTVIQSKDKTFVLGSNGRGKNRRAVKTPKKYSDYVSVDVDNVVENIVMKDIKKMNCENLVQKEMKIKRPIVNLEKFDFSHLIPYCMVHNLHDCFCGCKSIVDSNENIEKIKKKPLEIKKCQMESNGENNFNNSARTRGIDYSRLKSIRKRNLNPEYLRKIWKYLQQKDDDIKTSSNIEEEQEKTKKLTVEPIKIKCNPRQKSERKRKQQMEVREDSDNKIIKNREPAIQRRKTNSKEKNKEKLNNTADKLFEICNFKEHTIYPNDLLKHALKKLMKAEEEVIDFRLIPWKLFLSSYSKNVLQVWFYRSPGGPRIIITHNNERPSKKFVSVRLFEMMNVKTDVDVDFIYWLVTHDLPNTKITDNVLVALAFIDNQWEVCGVCEKPNSSTLFVSFTPINVNYNGNNDDINPELRILKYTDVNNKRNEIGYLECYYNIRRMTYERHEEVINIMNQIVFTDSKHTKKNIIIANLPRIGPSYKWRVVYLNSHFSFIAFQKNLFSIQYKDLYVLIKRAISSSKTLLLQNEHIKKSYPHNNFGIYASSNCFNAIFIGPYYVDKMHDFEVLKYEEGVLLNIDQMNTIKGKTQNINSFWCYETMRFGRTDFSDRLLEKLIDWQLSAEKASITKKKQSSEEIEENSDEVVFVDTTKENTFHEYNKVFVTNVNEIGYLEGYKFKDSKIIDVKWFDGSLKRYSNVTSAVTAIEGILRMRLIPVPFNFTIDVLVLDKELKPKSITKQMNTNILEETYLVGKFGLAVFTKENLLRIQTITGISNKELKKIEEVSDKSFVKAFAEFSRNCFTENVMYKMKMEDVIRKGIGEIAFLKKWEKQLMEIKKIEEAKRTENLLVFANTVNKLPKALQIKSQELMKKALETCKKPRSESTPTKTTTDLQKLVTNGDPKKLHLTQDMLNVIQNVVKKNFDLSKTSITSPIKVSAQLISNISNEKKWVLVPVTTSQTSTSVNSSNVVSGGMKKKLLTVPSLRRINKIPKPKLHSSSDEIEITALPMPIVSSNVVQLNEPPPLKNFVLPFLPITPVTKSNSLIRKNATSTVIAANNTKLSLEQTSTGSYILKRSGKISNSISKAVIQDNKVIVSSGIHTMKTMNIGADGPVKIHGQQAVDLNFSNTKKTSKRVSLLKSRNWQKYENQVDLDASTTSS